MDIVGVDTDNVGSPRNDHTAGSALNAVPIKLNRYPSATEAELLVAHCDRASSFTMMHRPGIARVVGDTLVLGGTTSRTFATATPRRCASSSPRPMPMPPGRSKYSPSVAPADKAAATAHSKNVRYIADDITF